MLARMAFVAMVVTAACGGGDSENSGLGTLDGRCQALCADTDTGCEDDTARCELECQVRVAGMEPTCATCLLENSNAGTCGGGSTCCPDPEFNNSVLECASLCSTSEGVNPSGNHPICAAICATTDITCEDAETSCLAECNARVQGVTGLCALCLLEDANGGVCGGSPCCPDNPEFPTSVQECASVCAN